MDRAERNRQISGISIDSKRAVVTAPLPIADIQKAFESNTPTRLPGKDGLWLVQSVEMEGAEGGGSRWTARAIEYHEVR